MRAAWAWVAVAATGAAQEAPPVYQRSRSIEIGQVKVAGEHVRLAYFTTEDGLEPVVASFERAWRERGWVVVSDASIDEAVISAFHTREGTETSVVLVRRGARTIGFSAVKDLRHRDRVDRTFATPEGALYEFHGDELGGTAALFNEPLARVTDRLRGQLGRAGYRALNEDPARGVLRHMKGAEILTTVVRSLGAELTLVFQTQESLR